MSSLSEDNPWTPYDLNHIEILALELKCSLFGGCYYENQRWNYRSLNPRGPGFGTALFSLPRTCLGLARPDSPGYCRNRFLSGLPTLWFFDLLVQGLSVCLTVFGSASAACFVDTWAPSLRRVSRPVHWHNCSSPWTCFVTRPW